MNIGKAIKELRISKGLNQSELAVACNLTQTSLSQIETGIKRPNPGTMKKICNFFKVPEVVIYLIATEEADIPEAKRSMYQNLFPDIKNILVNLFQDN
jgi:transcriptional regulator with XRE-family HTH domain